MSRAEQGVSGVVLYIQDRWGLFMMKQGHLIWPRLRGIPLSEG